jgi:hypothetical protein
MHEYRNAGMKKKEGSQNEKGIKQASLIFVPKDLNVQHKATNDQQPATHPEL